MKIALLAGSVAAAFTASSFAGFAGFVANVRNLGGNTVIDIFAATTNSSDKFLNVYNVNASTTVSGGFVQKAGLATKTWKPDTAGFTSTRNTSDDSFMTAGTFSGGVYGGQYYASTNTNADPFFSGTSWNGTPASAAATTIPANAGWYTGTPSSVDNVAESLAGLTGRVDGSGFASQAQFGIWCAHLVVAGENREIGIDVSFSGFASIKDGLNGSTSQGTSDFSAVPAPGALALLGVAGFAARRRRA